MRIRLTLISTMKNVFPEETMNIELHEGATLADLYEKIAGIATHENSTTIWNPVTKRFRGPVIITCDSKVIQNEHTRLYNGQHIEIKRFLIGG